MHVENGAGSKRRLPRRRVERGALAHKLGALAVALILLVGVGAYAGWVPTLPQQVSPPDPATVGPPAVGPGLTVDRPPAAVAVLPALESRTEATRKGIKRRLAQAVADRSLERRFAIRVESASSRRVLYQDAGSKMSAPASLLKLLTVVAALSTLGPEHRFETTVVRHRGDDSLVLVGGGDPLLTDRRRGGNATSYPRGASLEELANATARRLKSQGVKQVDLGYDESLFSGTSVNPAWEPDYVPESIVSPISALWVNEGREVAGLTSRVADPAAAAAATFGELLGNEGIAVTGPLVEMKAPGHAKRVASVQSPPLREIVEHVVGTSDNEGAEVLLRHTAIEQRRPATFKGGVEAVEAALADLGVDVAGARIFDGSGLSRQNRVSIRSVVDVLQTALSAEHPELRAAVSGLAVAGFTGSLAYRFGSGPPTGLGVVRAKTGTLTGVHGLAGIVSTVDGELLVFAAVADKVPVALTLDARDQLDRVASLLAGCGCSG